MGALLLLGIKYFEFLLHILNRLINVINPLLLGLAIAYVLNILVQALERIYFPHSSYSLVCKTKRPLCIVLSLFIIVGIIVALFVIVIPQLIGAFKILFDNIPAFLNRITDLLNHLSQDYPMLQEYHDKLHLDFQVLIKSALTSMSALLSSFFSCSLLVAGTITNGIINFVIGLIFAIYLLMSKETLHAQLKRVLQVYLKPHLRDELYLISHLANDSFSSYITGQCMEAVILGTLCTLGMWLFRFPYAAMIGTFIGATALIPIVGASIGATLGVIMILTTDPIKAFFFIIYIVILQQLENNFIYPKVVGSSIGLPGIWVLVAVTIGGGLGGIIGMIVGVPLTATLYKLIKIRVNRRMLEQQDH